MEINIDTIEKLMQLMNQYKIDQLNIETLTLLKSKHQTDKVVTSKEILDKHMEQSKEPLDKDLLDAWAAGLLMPTRK